MMMTEDMIDDGANYSDDFSLASGFDDIDYDDPFNSNQHNNNVGSIVGNNNNEGLIFGKPMQGAPNIISNRTNLLELPVNVTLFQSSAIDKGTITTQIAVDQVQHNSSCRSSSLEPTAIRNIDPLPNFLAENGIASMNSACAARKTKDLKMTNQASSSSLKSAEAVAVKARKTATKMSIKPSKSSGVLALALQEKYSRNTLTQQQLAAYSANAQQIATNIAMSSSTSMFSSSIGYSPSATNTVNGIGNNGAGLSSGKVNDNWNIASGQQTHNKFVVGGTNQQARIMNNNRICSLPPTKSSSMHDLLLQSKAQCRSQSMLRQSSTHSLSKRNSFQSIKRNKKLDVSPLLPAGRYAKPRNDLRTWSLPNAATSSTVASKSASASTKTPVSAIINVDDQIVANASTNDAMRETTDSLLHQACRLFPNSHTVVETALQVDVDAVRRSMVINGDQEGGSSKKTNSTTYGYPINLALAHGANAKILKLLVQAGPDVLAFKDGENCAASMGTALSLNTCDKTVVLFLLSANQQCARIADRRGNYPLHVSVSYGRSVDIVKRLYAVYPEAQGMRNFHSQTPLDIAIQSTRCSDDVTEFLRSMACSTPYC